MRPELQSIQNEDVFKAFLAAWRAARPSYGGLPSRSDITIRGFAQFVSNLTIFEKHESSDWRFRLVGSEVASRTAIHQGSQGLYSFWTKGTASQSGDWLEVLVQSKVGGVCRYSTQYQNGQCRDCRSMILPILSRDNDPLLLVFTNVGSTYEVRHDDQFIKMGKDYVFADYFDVGYGLPDKKHTAIAVDNRASGEMQTSIYVNMLESRRQG